MPVLQPEYEPTPGDIARETAIIRKRRLDAMRHKPSPKPIPRSTPMYRFTHARTGGVVAERID